MRNHVLDNFSEDSRYFNDYGPGSTSLTETIETSDPDYFCSSAIRKVRSKSHDMEYCNLLDTDEFL